VSCRQGEATLIIHPGDILLGDLCGVICIPRSLAQDALELVETLARTESQLAEAIDQGMSMTEASKLR
jgi:regulator of RNase E activity RraA